MPSRSCLALGARRTRLGAPAMLVARFADDVFDVQLFALAGIELLDTDLDLGAKLGQRLDVLEQLAPELLLRRFGKRGRLGHCQFECLDHAGSIPNSPLSALTVVASRSPGLRQSSALRRARFALPALRPDPDASIARVNFRVSAVSLIVSL